MSLRSSLFARSPEEIVEPPSDADLLTAAGTGDRDAFRSLYARIANPLYSLAYRVTGNQADAEELTQETFVELWKQAPDYDAKRALPLTFATRIIRNRAIDRIRKKSRRERISMQSAPDIIESSQSAANSNVADRVQLSDASSAVRNAFRVLNEDQRTILQLAYFGGMTLPEIAEKLSQPLGTVKSRVRRGLQKLRSELEGKL